MNSLNIKTGDKVQVISGAEKGSKGKVVQVSAKEGKVIVEGVNMVTLVCPKCDKTTRVAHKIQDGKKIRVCKHCGAELKY